MPATQEKVLVTGSTGFIGAQVLDLLLKKGYHARITARTQKKADAVIALYPQYKGKLEAVVVEDLANPASLKGVLNGLTGVFHVASPVSFSVKSNLEDLINPAVNGTLSLLKEAATVPSIKRFVYTASIVCMFDFSNPPTYVYSEKDYNKITLEQAAQGDGLLGYVGSKTLAEKAAFDFITANKPHFDLVSLCPTMVYGPIAHHIDKLSDLSETPMSFYQIVSGQKEPGPTFDWYVDVRDLALSHLLAFERPEASGQRYLISQGNYSWQELCDYAHKHFAGTVKAKVGTPGQYPPPGLLGDNSKSIKELGLTYRPKEETYHDTIAQLLEFEAQGK